MPGPISPTYDEVVARAEALAARSPALLKYQTIGLSEEGRPIPMLTAGDPSRDRPLLMITGGTHGSEETGRATSLAFAEWLVGEGREALDSLAALIVPCVNPDGAELNSYHNARDINLYHCHNFPGPSITAEGRAVEQVALEHLPDCLVDVHGLAGGAMGDSGFVVPMLSGEYGLVIALGVTEELCAEGTRLGFPQRHPFIEGLLREAEAPLVEKLTRTNNALTYTMEITENYYPLEDSVKSGLGRLKKLVGIGRRAQYSQPYPGFPCDVLAGGPNAALMAFGNSYRKRRESRVKLAALVRSPEVYFERSHADPGGVATVVLRVASELAEAPEGLVLQCALDPRLTIRRVRYEWPGEAGELDPGGLDVEHGYHVWHQCGILMVRASIARRASAGERRLVVEYEAPFAPHVRPWWRVFSSEGPGARGQERPEARPKGRGRERVGVMGERARVTQGEIAAGLREVGIVPGDVVFVHAAMGAMGYVEGGAPTVVAAFREAVGPEGTLAMPGFSFQLGEQTAPVFDVRHTPCWASKLYEHFRTRPGVLRSHHVTHSVCAIGGRARELTGEHSITPCGPESPFVKFAAWGAKVILLGVSHNSNTTFHAVEERERLWYVGFKDLPGATIIDEQGAQRPIGSQIHDMARPYDFNRVSDLLDGAGIQRQAAIGDAVVRGLDAARMVAAVTEAVRRDPEALLKQGETEIGIRVRVR